MLSRLLIFAGILLLFFIISTAVLIRDLLLAIGVGFGICGPGIVVGASLFYTGHKICPNKWWIYCITSVLSAIVSVIVYVPIFAHATRYKNPPTNDSGLAVLFIFLLTDALVVLVGAFFGSGLWRWSRKNGWIS